MPAERQAEAIEVEKWILVVEDDAGIRHALAEALRYAGWKVVVATNVDEALTLLHANIPIAAVVTDVEMPGKLNGLHLVDAIDHIGTPIVVAVASGMDVSKRLRQGVKFFAKPYSTALVIAFLQEALKS